MANNTILVKSGIIYFKPYSSIFVLLGYISGVKIREFFNKNVEKIKQIIVPVKLISKHFPAYTTHPPNVESLLAHRLRRRPNIGPTLGGVVLFLLGT